jgi:hypothetical protein
VIAGRWHGFDGEAVAQASRAEDREPVRIETRQLLNSWQTNVALGYFWLGVAAHGTACPFAALLSVSVHLGHVRVRWSRLMVAGLSDCVTVVCRVLGEADPLFPAGVVPLFPAGVVPLFPAGVVPLFPVCAGPLFPAAAVTCPLFPVDVVPLFPIGVVPLFPVGVEPLLPVGAGRLLPVSASAVMLPSPSDRTQVRAVTTQRTVPPRRYTAMT